MEEGGGCGGCGSSCGGAGILPSAGGSHISPDEPPPDRSGSDARIAHEARTALLILRHRMRSRAPLRALETAWSILAADGLPEVPRSEGSSMSVCTALATSARSAGDAPSNHFIGPFSSLVDGSRAAGGGGGGAWPVGATAEARPQTCMCSAMSQNRCSATTASKAPAIERRRFDLSCFEPKPRIERIESDAAEEPRGIVARWPNALAGPWPKTIAAADSSTTRAPASACASSLSCAMATPLS